MVREGHEWPELHAFPSLDDLVAFLKNVKSLLAIRAYIFRGRRLRISKGPYRYLLDGNEKPIPLPTMFRLRRHELDKHFRRR